MLYNSDLMLPTDDLSPYIEVPVKGNFGKFALGGRPTARSSRKPNFSSNYWAPREPTCNIGIES
jgi:hypothetical protein